MKRLWRIIIWTGTGLIALLLVIVAAALIFTRTAQFNDILRVQIVQYLAQTYRGRITIGAIEGSVWGSLTLRDIEVHHNGATIASIPQLRVGYEILPALHRRIVLSDLEVLNPQLHLARDPDGRWNLLNALAERNPSPPSSTPLNLALRRFSIAQARLTATTAPSVTYQLTDGYFGGTGNMGISGQTFNMDTLSCSLSGPRMLPLRISGAVHYHEAAQVATIQVPAFAIWTDRSQIGLTATLRDLSEKNLNATINVRKLAAADVNSIAPQAGLAQNLTGTIRISGKASSMRASIALAAGNARLSATAAGNLTSSQPVWKVDSQLLNADLHKLVKPANPQQLPAGTIDATVHADGHGTSPAAVKGQLDTRVTGLGARGLLLGNLTLSAAVEHRTANLKALLAGPGGHAQLAGRVDIAKVPSYDLTLALDHLRPANVIKIGIPPADLNFNAAVDGSGYKSDTMRLRAQVILHPSTVRSIRLDSGRLDAQLSSGIVRIAGASLKAGDTNVDLNGQVALDPSRSGLLNYNLAVGQLSQWLALAGRHGSGSVHLAGQAQGNLKSLRTVGSAEISALRLDYHSVAHARLAYDISGLGSPLNPAGQAMLLASGLHAGIDLKSLQTTVRLTQGPALNAAVNINAEDRSSRPATMRADIAYRPGLILVNLAEMAVATPHGSWQLTAPSQVTLRGATVEVRRLAVANRNQSIVLAGTASRSGPQNLTLNVEQLYLGDFAAFMPQQVKVAGLASTDLSLRGTAAAPVIAMSASITQLKLADIPQAGMSANVSYSNGHLKAEATLRQDPSHSLNATAGLPLALSWAQGFEARPTGDIDLRAVSTGLNLAVLSAFSRQLNDVGGTLTLDVAAQGPLLHPVPRGFIRLSGFHATANPLKVEVSAGSADIQLESGAVRLVTLSAKAGDGTLTGAGVMTLKPNGAPERLDAHLALDRWPGIATHEYNATIAARLNAAGPLTAIKLGGDVEVLYATFRPDLSLTGSAPRPDKTITVVHQWSVTPQQPPPPPKSTAASGPTYRNLAIDMNVKIDRDTWIKTPDFAVEMEGHVHIHKPPDGEPNLSGTINTVRGTIVVAGRQFNLAHGQIMFTGGHKINPELDIVAQQQVQTYTVSVTVSGTAEKPKLTLSSTPALPQADILSVMMFGKTTTQLSGGQQKDLQNQAASMAGGFAASQIGQAVAQSLGLSNLGVTTSSSGVGIGHYLTKNVYVSASQSASNMQDRRAEIQYYITPEVNLSTSASTNYGNEIKLQWHKDY